MLIDLALRLYLLTCIFSSNCPSHSASMLHTEGEVAQLFIQPSAEFLLNSYNNVDTTFSYVVSMLNSLKHYSSSIRQFFRLF